MWVYKDVVGFGKEFGNMGLLVFCSFFFFFWMPAILHSLEFGDF